MKTGILLKMADPLGAVAALAGQVRSEVERTLKSEAGGQMSAEDGFKTSRYQGRRTFKRQQHVAIRERRPSKVDSKKRWAAIRKHNLSLALPGELLLGDWLKDKAAATGHDRTWVLHRLKKGCYPQVTFRRVNLRLVFVKEGTAS